MKKLPYTIATLGSHSALQILKGAKDEGFATLIVSTKDKSSLYRRFPFVDEIIEIPDYTSFAKVDRKLRKKNYILVPHGSFVAYLGTEGNKKLKTPYFGNKKVLDWEADRKKQRRWITEAGLWVPRKFSKRDRIDPPVIVKSYGADGGKGYFVAHSQTDFEK